MKEKTRQALISFVEKANKLEEFGLHKHIIETGLGFHVQRSESDEHYIVEFDLPDEEKRDASLLTLRMFIQQNEPFSIPQFNNLATDEGLSTEFRSFLVKTRNAYNDYLNRHPSDVKPGFFEEGEYPTNREILDVVLYGNLSHTKNTRKRNKFEIWTRDDIRECVLLQRFTRIINTLLFWIYEISEECARELEGAPILDE